MIIVNSGYSNTLEYYSRYNMINKWEILDHNSRIILSGNTTISGISYKIVHSGITYGFAPNDIFTYKSYFFDSVSGKYYLANQSLLQSYADETRLNKNFKERTKQKNTFNTFNKNAPTTTTTTTV